ncbi:MAG: DegT/DnrJ/EryC1/StrS family aminotransferase [Chthoniobacterales bacterium]
MSKLAINGGTPVRKDPLPVYRTIGEEEKRAVMEVMDSGNLSEFLGTWSPKFFGGPKVQAFEAAWAKHFGVKHTVSVNSNTSGLNAAVGAAGVGPGDEVIVSPYSMSASAACAIVNNAVPVFADIDEETFNISAKTIAPLITARTKAIVVVDIFGHPADFVPIMELAKKHNLIVIEDAAQAPGATYQNRFAGTLAHIGVFSLNYHKTIHTGEGGVVVTNDAALAERIQLIRNHAEVVVQGKGVENIVNMVGQNYRMTEIEAAIGIEQLKKLPALMAKRQKNAEYLTKHLKDIPGLISPSVREDSTHGFYVYPMRYIRKENAPMRQALAAAIRAEGIPVGEGYVEPIYLQPLYQRRIALGDKGAPFTKPYYDGEVKYDRGICPVTERMHFEEVLIGDYCHANLEEKDMDDICAAYKKVFSQLETLKA